MTEESCYMSFGGAEVHFCVYRPDVEEKNRIFILGSPVLNVFHWRKLLPELNDEGCLTVIADLPGFGKSDCSDAAPADLETQAGILWGILDEVDTALNTPMSLWHLCTHGIASPVLLQMAQMAPESVKSLIFINPLFSLDGKQTDYQDIVHSSGAFKKAAENAAAHNLDNYVLDRMRAPFLRRGACAFWNDYLQSIHSTPTEGIGFCPAMVLCGTSDPLVTEERNAQCKNLLQGAEIHKLRGAGHFLPETHSKVLRDYFRGWLRYNQ